MDSSAAASIELYILRQLSAYKDELIRRLYSELFTVRKCLEETITLAENSSCCGATQANLGADIAPWPNREPPRRLVTPVPYVQQARVAPSIQVQVHSGASESPRFLRNTAKLQVPPSAVSQRQRRKAEPFEISPAQLNNDPPDAVTVKSEEWNAALLRPEGVMKIPCHAVHKHRLNTDYRGPIRNVMHHRGNPKPLGVHAEDVAWHAAMRQKYPPTNGIKVAAGEPFTRATPCSTFSTGGWPQQQKAHVAYAASVCESENKMSGFSKPSARDAAATPTPLSKISPHKLEALKLQLSGQSVSKRGRERISILSTGSTCSSISSRRRPWE